MIEAWLYYPDDVSLETTTPSSPKPALINWHGSGFVFPSLSLDHEYCSRIAQKAGIFVLDADYRKAPEHPYPAPVEDVEDVFAWVGEQSAAIDASRLAVSGFSAGGVLAFVAASVLRSSYPRLNIRAALGVYPGTDLATDPQTRIIPEPVQPIPPKVLDIFFDSYAPLKSSRTDPRVSPLFADPELYPPNITILTCSGDVLKPEADALAARLTQRSTPCRVNAVTLDDMPHGFDKGCKPGSPEWEKKELAYEIVINDLKMALL